MVYFSLFHLISEWIHVADPNGAGAATTNHSCVPNCFFKEWYWVGESGNLALLFGFHLLTLSVLGEKHAGVFLMSSQKIQANSYITVQYGWDESSNPTVCLCGEQAC